MRRFTLAQLKKESTLDRPLFAIDGNVYDMTDFVDTHPGGEILLDFHGTDVTAVMKDSSIHSHSEAAYRILRDFKVGTLEGFESKSAETHPSDIKDKEDFIDLRKPLFHQLWLLDISTQEYVRQIHIPRHLSEPARFFSNPFLEFLSRTPWYVVPAVWLPVVVYMLHVSTAINGLSKTAGLFCRGVLVWTLLEYVLHRFLFHFDEWLPNHKVFQILHFTFHGVHHFLPMDRMRLVFPPVLCLILSSLVYRVFLLLFSYANTPAMFAGGLFGYICYDMMHYYLHHGTPVSHYLKSMKKYHVDHHYKNVHEGYGITSKLWDYAFFTMPADKTTQIGFVSAIQKEE